MRSKKLYAIIGLSIFALLLYTFDNRDREVTSLNLSKFEFSDTIANQLDTHIYETEENPKNKMADYKSLDWVDLIPEEELEILSDPSKYIDEDDYSLLDQIMEGMTLSLHEGVEVTTPVESDNPFIKAMLSTNVNSHLDGQSVKIAGFIVPLEFNAQKVTQFLLVPFYGACIHVPPPSPNQVIMVDFPDGLKLENLFDPMWIAGKMTTTIVKTEIGTSAYSIKARQYEEYF